MAVHLVNKPIVFPSQPGDPDRIIAPPASGASSEQNVDTSNLKLPQDRLPTVITLKDGTNKLGNIQTRWLDNSFQKALLRAQARLTGGSLPREQEEWRLPHAPVPSRPDFSRVVPVYDDKINKRRRGKHMRRETYPKTTKDQSSEPEYILPPIHIPTLKQNAFSDMATNFPSTKLSKNIVTSSQPVYLPFVGSASLHPKSVTRTVIREPLHHLPGLCRGCRCLTHMHDFKGYLFLDSNEYDIEGAVSESGNGGSLYDDEVDEEGMMGAVGIPVGGSVCHGCAISDITHFHYNSHDGKSVIGINTPPPSQFSSIDSGHYDSMSQTVTQYSALINGALTERDPSEAAEESGEVLFSVERISDPEVPIHQHTVPRQKPPKLPQWIMDLIKDPQSGNAAHKIKHYEDHCYACEQALRQFLPDNPILRQFVPDHPTQNGKFLGDDLHYFKHAGHRGDNSEVASTSGIGTSISEGASMASDVQRLDVLERLKAEEDAKETEKEKQKEEERIQNEKAEQERRKNLYKAPKAFKPKKMESSVTTGEDPFSKERSYNIPQKSGFKVKKSDKGPTTQVEIQRDESGWNAPKKFELKKGPSKVTKADWNFSKKTERLRPKTPPPPPPPAVKQKPPTVPIVPKRRQHLEQIPSLREPQASPPRKRKVEVEKKKPSEKIPVKEPEPKKFEPEPIKTVQPEKVMTGQAEPGKVKAKPEPKKVTKIVKLSTKVKKPKKVPKTKRKKKVKKRKPELSQDTDDSSDEDEEELSPTPEHYILDSPSPAPSPESTPLPTPSQIPLPPSPPPTPSQIALPPSPTPDQIPLPPSRPPTPSPTPPPPEPPSPPPKELTPPPPKEPTSPPPVEKPKVAPPKPKSKPSVSKPVKPKNAMKPKREKKKAVANRKVINKRQPAAKAKTEAPKPPSPKDESNKQIIQKEEQDKTTVDPDSEVKDDQEPDARPPEKPKNLKIPKLPKAVFKKKIPLVIKEYVRKEKKTSAPWILPEIPKWKDGIVDMPNWPEGIPPEIKAMISGNAPPLPAIPEPKPKTPEPEPEPKPKLPPAPKVAKKPPQPIVWRKRQEYKPKRRKMRAVKADSPEPEEEPVIRDALDFLSEYCIVHKERVPLYQHVFNTHLVKQGVIVNSDDEEDIEADTLTGGRQYRLKSLSGSEIDPNDEDTKMTEQQKDGGFEETFKSGGGEENVDEDNYVSPLDLTATEKMNIGEALSEVAETVPDSSSKVIFANPPQNSLAVDDHLDKIAFTMENIYQKTVNLEDEILQLEDTRRTELANLARHEFPKILRADYISNSRAESPKKEKKGQKKKSKEKGAGDATMVIEKLVDNTQPSILTEVYPTNNDWVIGRLNESQNQQLDTMPEVRTLTLRLERANEKLTGAKNRIKDLLKERDVLLQMGQHLRIQESSTRPAANDEFRRKQSSLYQNINPEMIHDISIEDVEPLMKQVNRHLITEKECQYVYHVLDLPQRHRLDFKLFTVVAALSEKVTNLEPFIRNMINKMNFDALDVKMSKAKELFYLLEDEDSELRGSGEIPLDNMRVELEAGGLSPEHVNMVVDKFGREGKQTVDFLDFLTYILLFVDIHDYILSDPLNSSRTR